MVLPKAFCHRKMLNARVTDDGKARWGFVGGMCAFPTWEDEDYISLCLHVLSYLNFLFFFGSCLCRKTFSSTSQAVDGKYCNFLLGGYGSRLIPENATDNVAGGYTLR